MIRRKVEEGEAVAVSAWTKDTTEVPCWYFPFFERVREKKKPCFERAILLESVCDDVDDWNKKDLHSVITTRMMLMPILRSWLNLSPNGE